MGAAPGWAHVAKTNEWCIMKSPLSIPLIGAVLFAGAINLRAGDDKKADKPVEQARYDFIIAGGGTAGCVVAGRLAENPRWKILVLERGPADFPAIHIPSQWWKVLENKPTRDVVVSAKQN